jgi:hypothetical protein
VSGLRSVGFDGFVPFREVATRVTDGPGVYVVVRDKTTEPEFQSVSVGGPVKGKDSSYPLPVVAANWIPGATVVYIGKADARKSNPNGLALRLDEYRRFGRGEKVLHGGGRLIWQLDDHEDLLVAWRPTPSGASAEASEDEMLLNFMAAHDGRMPFANLRLPRRAARAHRVL